LTLACITLFSAMNLTAQTTQYVGPPHGDWFDANNWSEGLPAVGKVAQVGGGSSVVIGSPLTSNFTINNYGTITFSANFINNSIVFSLGDLVFTATADVTNNGSFSSLGTALFATGADFTNETGGSFVNGGNFTLPTTMLNKGDIVNNGNLNATDGMVQTQGTFENNQTMTVEFLTVASGTSLANNSGANLNITGSGSTFTANGLVNNFGTITNAGSTVVNGVFNNTGNGLLKTLATGELKINAGKTFDNSNGRLENEGKFENHGTFINGHQFLNKNDARNFGQFLNNNFLSNIAGGVFRNEVGGTISMGYGSQLLNPGNFENEGQITSHGLVQNDGVFENDGTIANTDGSVLENNNQLTNNGTITTINIVRNYGIFTNKAVFNINSGAVLSNYATFNNLAGAVFTNSQDIVNKTEAVFTNSGTANNVLRFTNEGTVTNSSTFNNPGDIFNKPGAVFSNSASLLLAAGNIRNEGSLTNTNQLTVDDCSSIRNTGSVANNGTLTLRGILFQTGSFTGNAPMVDGGYIHVSPNSNAPSICKDGTFGANINGEIKVYAQELIAYPNFESCNNMIYKANGLDRPVFHCSDIGSVLNVDVVLKTRLNDVLTCVAQVIPVDLLAPEFTTPCLGNIQKTTMGSSATATWTPPAAVDNCSATTLNASHAPGSSFPIGSTTVSYTAKDVYNNTNNCAFTVTVNGLTSCTSNLSPANDATGINPASVTFTWNAATNATHYDLYLGTNNPPTNKAKSDVFATTTTVTGLTGGLTYFWYVVPKNGNGAASDCQQVNTTSFATQPPCVNVTNAGAVTANQTICNGNDPVAFSNATPPVGGTGTLEYIWQLSTLDPTVNPNAWSTIDGAVSPTFDPPVLTQSTWYRRGARRGNCSDYLFTEAVKVTIITTPAPQLDLGQPLCSALSGSLTINNLPSGFYSKLDNGLQTLNKATYANIAPGQHTLTIGSNGCDKSAQFTINALPAAPIASCQNIARPLTTANGNSVSVLAAEINNGSTGGCSPLSFKINNQSSLSFTCANLGPNAVTLLVTDAAGRTTSCSATITVQDLAPPTLVCKNFSATLNAAGQASISPADVFQSGTDNCTGTVNLVSVVPNTFTCANTGTVPVLLTANDGRGNASTCTAQVTVQDVTPPTVVCKNLEVMLDANGQANITPDHVFQSGIDNCGSVNLVSVEPNSFGCNNLDANVVTLTADDGKGNSATCTASVTVNLNASAIVSYTILAQDEIHMHKNTVAGNLGIWKAGKQARIHDATTVTGFVRSPLIDLDNSSVITGMQTLAQSPEPPLEGFKYNTMPDPPSDVKVPDNYAGVYLLNGTNFKKIEVGKNATAKFTATGIIYVKEFIIKDADAGKQTSVQFSGNTELVVRRKIDLGKRSNINWGSPHRVKFYIEEDNSLIRESAKVNASIDIRFKDLNVNDGTEQNHTVLNGQFIAKKVDAKKRVDWSWSPYECGSLPPIAPLIAAGDDLGLVAQLDHEEVNLNWVTNTDYKSISYVVERSTNGVDFEPLLEMLPATDAEHLSLYKNKDTQPNLGANFYRVRATFVDGTEAVSAVRAVELQFDRSALTLFPNPAHRHVSVYFEKMVGKAATVTVHNSFGYQVLESRHHSLPDAPWQLEWGDLPEGMYWLWLKVDGLRERSVRFVVVK